MDTKHLEKLFSFGEFLKCIPLRQLQNSKIDFKDLWASVIVVGLVLALTIYNSINWLLQFYKRTSWFLQLISAVSFLVFNLYASWVKRGPWQGFLESYYQVDQILNKKLIFKRNGEYIKLISIYIIVHTYLIVFSLQFYCNSTSDLNLGFHLLMFLQNYYQVVTSTIIITINVSIKFQYSRINKHLMDDSLYNSNSDKVLNSVEHLYWMMKKSVDDFTDVFGWQLVIIHGQIIINLLGILSEVALSKQNFFGVIQMQQSVFTVSMQMTPLLFFI